MGDSECAGEPEVQPEVDGGAERGSWVAMARGLALAALAVGIFGGVHAYVALRLIEGARLVGGAASLAWAATFALFASIPLTLLLRGALPRPLATAALRAVYLWLGLLPLLLTAVALADAGSAAAALARGAPLSERWSPGLAAAVVGACLLALAYGVRSALGPPKIEELDVPIDGLGPGLDGLRIVQISDLHVGETLRADWVRRVVDQVNRLRPDVVAITGDVADGDARAVREDLAPLRSLAPKLGSFFVTGNHEYYSGAEEYEALLRELGVQVLHNEHRVLARGGDSLVVAGVTDVEGGRFSPAHAPRPDLAFSGAPAGAPRVLLAHQPRAASSAAPFAVDLQLSGHTHGGQVFPWMLLVRLQQPVLSGLKVIDGVRVYTHRGTGFWGPPVRFGARPEIACLTLVPGGRSRAALPADRRQIV